MTENIDQVAMQKAADDYSRVELDPKLRGFVVEIGQIIHRHVPSLNEIAIRGFMMRALKQTQQEHETKVDKISEVTVKQKELMIRDAFDNLYSSLTQLFTTKSAEVDVQLKAAIQESLKYRLSQAT